MSNVLLAQGQIETAARLMAAMGNEKRLLVLNLLACRGEISVGELAVLVDLSQSALSQHLATLRRDGLVSTRRQAQTVFYKLNSPAVVRMISLLSAMIAVSV